MIKKGTSTGKNSDLKEVKISSDINNNSKSNATVYMSENQK
jgi:hypothetical protein